MYERMGDAFLARRIDWDIPPNTGEEWHPEAIKRSGIPRELQHSSTARTLLTCGRWTKTLTQPWRTWAAKNLNMTASKLKETLLKKGRSKGCSIEVSNGFQKFCRVGTKRSAPGVSNRRFTVYCTVVRKEKSSVLVHLWRGCTCHNRRL